MQYIMLTCPPREAIFKATIAECPVKPIVVVDDAMAGAFDGFMRCLKLADGEPFVFLEDDLHFTSDFDAKVKEAIKSAPDHIVQLFAFKKSVTTPGLYGGSQFFSNLCNYFPRGIAPELERFAEENPFEIKRWLGGDHLVMEWLIYTKQKFYHHVPHLVQHRVGQKSVAMPKNRHARISSLYEE